MSKYLPAVAALGLFAFAGLSTNAGLYGWAVFDFGLGLINLTTLLINTRY